MLLPWLLPVLISLEHTLFLFDSGKWEHEALALRSTPVCWDLTPIKFSLICCEVAIHCTCVASFLLVLTDTEPCGNRFLRWWEPSFTYEDLCSSRWTFWFCCCIGGWRGWVCRFCTMCIIMVCTHSIAARIVSMLCSTLENYLACSSTSSMAECHPLWNRLFTAVEASETCWLVPIFLTKLKLEAFFK